MTGDCRRSGGRVGVEVERGVDRLVVCENYFFFDFGGHLYENFRLAYIPT
jgi:hypothetical protein